MTRVAVVCPGRGSYGREELGSLTRGRPGGAQDLLQAADTWRRKVGRESVTDLDSRGRFSSRHLAGENAAALIFTGSALDAMALGPGLEVVAVCGNSMGWYTALHVAGVFGFEDGLRLADTMGGYQADGVVGGQVITPVVGEDWRPDPTAQEEVETVLQEVAQAGAFAARSIHLGGFAVLAGDDKGIRVLLKRLPRRRLGRRDYPFQLLGHSAFHTPLMEPTARRARKDLADLPWRAPRASLVDGRGRVFRPRTADPEALRDYTLGAQVVTTFDFTTCLRVVLREFAPEALILLGPGDNLGGAVGQVLVREGWSGLHDKQTFLDRQASGCPILHAMGRPEQRARVAARS